MLVLDHVSISVPSLNAARPFYDAVMAALGVAKVYDLPDALGFGGDSGHEEEARGYGLLTIAVQLTPEAGT